MAKLSFLGLSEDGSALLVAGPEGQRHQLPIDERLRSAVRSGRTATDVIDLRDGTFGPKEIQQRVRAGATATEVAELCGWELRRVEAFAVPVVQERQFMAEKAQAATIGRGEEEPTLAEMVVSRLRERHVDPDELRWDSWLRDDGIWTVLCSYPAGKGDRVATWSFDADTKQLSCDDEEARLLVEDRLPMEPRPRLVSLAEEEPPVPAPAPATRHIGLSADLAASESLQDEEPDEELGERSAERPLGAEAHPAGRGLRTRNPMEPVAAAPVEPRVEEQPQSWDQVLFGAPEESRR